MPKSACTPLQIPYYRGFFKNEKGAGSSFQATFFIEFFDKKFFCNITKTGKISSPDCLYFSIYSVKFVLCFILRRFMTTWHLNIWKVKIWLSQEWKELSKWNKKHFYLFLKRSLLDIQNKLAKMWWTGPLQRQKRFWDLPQTPNCNYDHFAITLSLIKLNPLLQNKH